ncbi:MAG: histidinol-phosphate transaminase [Burkholderiales bacterium]
MSQFWSPVVATLTPYVPGEQPKAGKLIKLNTNENPYPPSPAVLQAIAKAASGDLRLYPDPNAEDLRAAIARYYKVAPRQVFVGNSSDEVLAHTFLGLLRHDQSLLFPDVTYSFYPVYCKLYGIHYETVPLDAEFRLRIEDYFRPNGGVIFPNPNAPTGRVLPLSDIERLLKATPGAPVVIDEAYVDFGGDSAIALVDKYPNLLVIQTLSKSRSLAGLRVGFAIGHADLIEGLNRVKNSFNSYPLDRLAQAGAIAAFEDKAYFDKTRQAIIASREKLARALEQVGMVVLPSAANFVLARHPARDAGELAAALRARQIIVRHFRAPRIEQFLRISVGTDEECDALALALSEILSAPAHAPAHR